MKNRDEISATLADLSRVRVEIKEAKSIIESSRIDFQRSFLKIFPPGTKLIGEQDSKSKNSQNPGHTTGALPPSPEEEDPIKIKKSDDKVIKKIYRKIALKTHPDKNSDKEDSEKFDLMQKYQDATEMYKRNRLVEILEIAHNLEIDISDVPVSKIKSLKKELRLRSEMLEEIKSNFFYIWSQSDFEKRCNTIFKIARDLNIDVEEEKIKLALRKTGLERTTGAHPGSHMKRIKNIPM